jgi:hypothetical protein
MRRWTAIAYFLAQNENGDGRRRASRTLRNQMAGCANGRAARTRAAINRAGDLLPIIADIRAGGAASLRAIATELNSRGIPTARGTVPLFLHPG